MLKATNISMEWTDGGCRMFIESTTKGFTLPCPVCNVAVGGGKLHQCGAQKPARKEKKTQEPHHD